MPLISRGWHHAEYPAIALLDRLDRRSVRAVTVIQVRPHLYRLLLGRYQAYLWRDQDSVTLIDTGEAGSGPAIVEALAGIGVAPDDLEQVVLTHHHDDHCGSARELRERTGARVVAHVADAPVIRGDQHGQPPNFTDFERELHAQVAPGLRRRRLRRSTTRWMTATCSTSAAEHR